MALRIFVQVIPFDKGLVTLALESGVDGLVVDPDQVEAVRGLGRATVLSPDEMTSIALASKKDEEEAVQALRRGEMVVLRKGWEIIPVENILAQCDNLMVEADSLEEARLAAGILERGVDGVLLLPRALPDVKRIVSELKISQGRLDLAAGVVHSITPVGLGHRVCVDTASLLRTGQGMLVGNSSAFTFLVHAETESNPYVAARPFRINAGALHSYAVMPGDRTNYLQEIGAGDEVLIVDSDGRTSLATVGRIKTEVRPMLLIQARCGEAKGNVFLQNAETIRLVRPDGTPVSVVALRPGDEILVKPDKAGRHFGMRISEEIVEE